MITVIIQIRVQPGMVDEFKAVTLANAEARIDTPGNLRFEIFQHEVDPEQFILIEVFESQAAIDAYYQSEAHRAWEAAIHDLWIEQTGGDYRILFPPN
ncbi:MAG: antibiotic biosynthesis monooxygenase [Anaerolineae bacterium]